MVQLNDQPESESKDMEGDTQPISYAYADAEEETQEVKVFSDVNLQITNNAVLKPNLERNGTELNDKEDDIEILETPPKPPPIMVDLEDGSDAEGGHRDDIANPASPALSADLLSQTNSDDEADTQMMITQTFLIPETILEDSNDTLMDQTRPSSSTRSADSDYESQPETSKVSTLLKLCYEVVKANIERFEFIRPDDDETSENGSRKTWRDVYNRLVADANFNTNVPRDSATTELSTVPAGPCRNLSQPSTSSSSTATITCQGDTTDSNGHRSDINADRPTTSTSTRNARGRAPTQPTKDILVITLPCDSPPPSPPPCAPYTAIGRSISNEVVTFQENCYREIRECINKLCKGTHQVPSDNTLTMLSIEMPVTWTEMGKIPGMSERTRFIYWPAVLKITKRYRSEKLKFYKTCHFPTTLQQAKDLCSTETSNGRNRKRTKAKRNRAGKGKQAEEAMSIVTSDSEDESARSDSPAVTSASPPAKRTRRARASKPTASAD